MHATDFELKIKQKGVVIVFGVYIYTTSYLIFISKVYVTHIKYDI